MGRPRKPGLEQALAYMSQNPTEQLTANQISERIGIPLKDFLNNISRIAKKGTTGLRIVGPSENGVANIYQWITTQEAYTPPQPESTEQNGNGEPEMVIEKASPKRGQSVLIREHLRKNPGKKIGIEELQEATGLDKQRVYQATNYVVNTNPEAKKIGTGLWVWDESNPDQPEEKPVGQLKVITRKGSKGLMVDGAGQLWKIEKMEW